MALGTWQYGGVVMAVVWWRMSGASRRDLGWRRDIAIVTWSRRDRAVISFRRVGWQVGSVL